MPSTVSATASPRSPRTATVTFEHAAQQTFDIVIGADGLHSGVRRLVFGDDVREHFLGGYLAVVSVPKTLAHEQEMIGFYQPRRVAMVYTADHLDDARAVFVFRPEHELDYDHRDGARQRELLRAAFAGTAPDVDRWLAELDSTPAFYFDAITQLQMDTWTRGRVTLVGDAGYCPGPGVGGSTSLAIYGAYILATQLRAHDDHTTAFRAYEDMMRRPVLGSRAVARVNAKTIVPTSRRGVDALVAVGRRRHRTTGRCDPNRRAVQRQGGPAVRDDAAARRRRIPRNHCGSGGLDVLTSWSTTTAG